jgi:hypothetical protein
VDSSPSSIEPKLELLGLNGAKFKKRSNTQKRSIYRANAEEEEEELHLKYL